MNDYEITFYLLGRKFNTKVLAFDRNSAESALRIKIIGTLNVIDIKNEDINFNTIFNIKN